MAGKMSDSTSAAIKWRKKTFMEMQPWMFTYSAAIGVVSPIATLYQMLRINPQIRVSTMKMIRLSAAVFPIQALLKQAQMNVMSPVKENVNVWAGFGVLGVFQGGVYGHCNIYFAKQLGITNSANYFGLFRGAAFAACRDMISQGVPFVCSEYVRNTFIFPYFPVHEDDSALKKATVHWSAILSTSVAATFLSQGFQNCQIHMQANPQFSYVNTIANIYQRNGLKFLYKGAEARVGLLLYVNILNQVVLKRAWTLVEDI